MKQGTKRTLGVAALGAAFVAAGAGSAAADTTDTLTSLAGTATGAAQDLPLDDVTKNVSGGSDTVRQLQDTLGETGDSLAKNGQKSPVAENGATDKAQSLLGGLPVSTGATDLAGGLPLGG